MKPSKASELERYIYAVNDEISNRNLSKPALKSIQFDEVNTHANP